MNDYITLNNSSLMHEITHSTDDIRWTSEVRLNDELKNNLNIEQNYS